MGMEWTSPTAATPAAPDFWDSPQWQVVLRWPTRAENKLAFAFVWRESRGGREQISVTGAMIGAAQGTSGDAGRTRIKNLRELGLIDVIDSSPLTGRYLIAVNDPFDVARAIRRTGDPQGQFDFLDDFESGPFSNAGDGPIAGGVTSARLVVPSAVPRASGSEEPPEVPRRAALPPGGSSDRRGGSSAEVPPTRASSSSIERLHTNSSSIFASSSQSLAVSAESTPREELRGREGRGSSGPQRGTPGGSSEAEALERRVADRRAALRIAAPAASAPPPTAAEVMAAVSRRLPTEEERERRVDEIAAHIARAVDDVRLRSAPRRHFAWQIVEGRIPRSELDQILATLREKRAAGLLACPPSAFFIACRNRCYRRHGVDLPQAKHFSSRRP